MTLTNLRTAAASSFAAAGLLLSLAACSAPATSQSPSSPAAESASASATASGPCEGVQVIVDSGALKQEAADTSACIAVEGPTAAAKVLEEANVKTVGTEQYPNELVCRVNGVPAADFDIKHKGGTYREECQKMPAAFAYWALWVKASPDAEWAYAQEGLATLKFSPGQSLELLFTVDGEPAAPKA
ncbi:hypothetical protein ACFWIX_00975 [Pseudarthrobacter sp. NPDC058362]|uniref:hypothetical protein n=1 Tax=Pseudarthrobacter sp. NPDC058362 TaxID=3346458 RepID=UPI0036589691